LLGSDIEELKKWATKVCQQKADIYLATVTQEQQRQDSKAGFVSYLSSWFVARPQATEQTNIKDQAEDEESKILHTMASAFLRDDNKEVDFVDEDSESDEFFDAQEELDDGNDLDFALSEKLDLLSKNSETASKSKGSE
jgi:hypothetical protein